MKNIEIKNFINTYPNFPKLGIVYRDIAPLLACPKTLAFTIKTLSELIEEWNPEVIVAIDSRGFLFATPIAIMHKVGVVMIRKKNKLPGKLKKKSYDLEYGSSTLEIQSEAKIGNRRVVVIDDLLATGGTLAAAESLLLDCEAMLTGNMVLIELVSLHGRNKLKAPLKSLQKFD